MRPNVTLQTQPLPKAKLQDLNNITSSGFWKSGCVAAINVKAATI
jgi:hypothetical protein